MCPIRLWIEPIKFTLTKQCSYCTPINGSSRTSSLSPLHIGNCCAQVLEISISVLLGNALVKLHQYPNQESFAWNPISPIKNIWFFLNNRETTTRQWPPLLQPIYEIQTPAKQQKAKTMHMGVLKRTNWNITPSSAAERQALHFTVNTHDLCKYDVQFCSRFTAARRDSKNTENRNLAEHGNTGK